MSRWTIIIVLFLIIVVGTAALVLIPGTQTVTAPANGTATTTGNTATTTPNEALSDLIQITSPMLNAKISSPLTISGQARGNWFFEASAPIALLDANGSVIAQGTVTANGEWTTTNFVPLSGSLTFPDQPAGSQGTLVLSNDNPSGNPATQKTLDIPVTF